MQARTFTRGSSARSQRGTCPPQPRGMAGAFSGFAAIIARGLVNRLTGQRQRQVRDAVRLAADKLAVCRNGGLVGELV